MFNTFKNEIKIAFSENKFIILISTAILLISIILGYIFQPYLYHYFNPVVEDLTNKVQTGVVKLTFEDVFFNNISIASRMFIFGIAFCFSAVILGFNGFFVGYYVASADNLLVVLLLIIPHGIFEFTSCILATAAGFILFNFLYKFLKTFLFQENNSIINKLKISVSLNFSKLKQAVILFAISAVLMAIAGIIEVYFTIHIANYIMSVLS